MHSLRVGLNLDYLDCHVGFACREEFLPITRRLAQEFCLTISSPELLGAERFVPDYPEAYDDRGLTPALLDALDAVPPGLHVYVGQPAVRSPELRAVDSDRGEFPYRRRGADFAARTDPDGLALIGRRGIELVAMGEFVPGSCVVR